MVSGCERRRCSAVRGTGPDFVGLFAIAFDRDGSLVVTDGELDALLRVDPVTRDRMLVSGCAVRVPGRGRSNPRLCEPLGIAAVETAAALAAVIGLRASSLPLGA